MRDSNVANLERTSESMISFSKHLISVVFVIFSFSSSTLIGSTIISAKITYVISLLFAIFGMYSGFRVILEKLNADILSDLNSLGGISNSSIAIIKEMKRWLRWQYMSFLTSLVLLTAAIVLKLFIQPNGVV